MGIVATFESGPWRSKWVRRTVSIISELGVIRGRPLARGQGPA